MSALNVGTQLVSSLAKEIEKTNQLPVPWFVIAMVAFLIMVGLLIITLAFSHVYHRYPVNKQMKEDEKFNAQDDLYDN